MNSIVWNNRSSSRKWRSQQFNNVTTTVRFRPPHLLTYLIMLPVLLSVITKALVTGDNCFGGVETFEKIAITSFTPDTIPTVGVLLQQDNVALTRDCINLCKQQQRCNIFYLDYRKSRCTSYGDSSRRHREHMQPSKTGNLFEKVCLKGISKQEFDHVCGNDRLWAFERVKDTFLEGFTEKELTNMVDREECAKACLTETAFICRSADFDEVKRICRLSKENRLTQPQAFVHVKDSQRDYLENQCAPSGPASCIYMTKADVNVFSMDSLQFATSAEDCQLQCDRETSFNCRAYGFLNNRCMLSADDEKTIGKTPPVPMKGASFGEKTCVAELCNNGIFTYEKITGHVLRSAIPTSVELPNYSSFGVTNWCRESCDMAQLNCPAFTINYQNNRCERLDRNTQGRTTDLVAREGESYFEKICLRVPQIMSQCQDKFWAFERVLGHELAPVLYVKTLNFVQSRRDCEEYCLQEREFPCRSALYNDETTECKLSPDDRRTSPGHYYRSRSIKVNYLENQCVRAHSACPYVRTSNAYPTYTDIVDASTVTSSEACEKMCNDNRHFLCRSYAYYSSNSQCFLSGDDSVSAGSAFIQKRSSIQYYERQCSKLATLNSTFANSNGALTDSSRGYPDSTSGFTSPSNGYDTSRGSSGTTGHTDSPGYSGSTGHVDISRGYPSSASGRPDSTRYPGSTSGHSDSSRYPGSTSGYPDTNQGFSGSGHPDSSRYPSSISGHPTDSGRPWLTKPSNGFTDRGFPSHPITGYHDSVTTDDYRTRIDESHVHSNDRSGVSSPTSTSNRPELNTGIVNKEVVIENGTIGGIITTRITRFPDTLLPTLPPKSILSTSDGMRNTLTSGETPPSSSSVGGVASPSPYAPSIPTDQHPAPHTPTMPKGDRFPYTVSSTNTKCAPNARFLFEKVTSFEPIGGHLTLLYSDLQNPGIVTECAKRCEHSAMCRAFVVDYYHQTCHGLFENSSVGSLDLRLSMGKDYFEGFCVPNYVHCDKYWPFDRIIDQVTTGVRPEEIVRFISRAECRTRCLEERKFRCLSASYNSFTHECHLYTEDRNSGSLSLSFSKGVDFMENQCMIDVKSCRYHAIERDISIVSVTKSLRGTSTFHCEQACDYEKEFNCRSYTYLDNPDGSLAPGGNLCLLSADNRATSHQGSMQFRPRALYAEKDCIFQKRTQPRQFGATLQPSSPRAQPGSGQVSPAVPDQLNARNMADDDFARPSPFEKPFHSYSQDANFNSNYPGGNLQPDTQSVHTTDTHSNVHPSINNIHGDVHPSVPHSSIHSSYDLFNATRQEPIEDITQLQHIPTRCSPGEYTFEKTFGYDLRYASRERAPIPARPAILNYCKDECIRLGDQCRAFVIEYGANQQQNCYFLGEAASEHRNQLSKLSGSSYNERICLRERPCDSIWTFERIIGYTLDEPADKEIKSIILKSVCQDLCLAERSFPCRSITYDYRRRVCRLFRETRKSKPQSFKPTSDPIDYFDNKCAKELSTCQYRDFQDRYFNFVDRVSIATSLTDCQRQCDAEQSFQCKSVNFDSISKECSLSSEDLMSFVALDTFMTGGDGGQQMDHSGVATFQQDSVFSERGNCEQVSVQCNQQDMILTLNFDSPFNGRIYTKHNPSQCYVNGNGQNQIQFAIPLNSRCGTHQESSSNYVNEVIVQQHSVIMTDSDRTIRVLCSFEVSDQTITLGNVEQSSIPLSPNGIDVSANLNGRSYHDSKMAATVVANTAAPPSIVMRILDHTGHDAQVVSLGDDLKLRIELKDQKESAFAMFARNLYARSSNGESLFLIDNQGCPVDPSVFPALNLDPSDNRSLYSKFKAFRFPATGVVNFEVQIRFCQEFCEPIKCAQSNGYGNSFGRRRRRRRRRSIESGVKPNSFTPSDLSFHLIVRDTNHTDNHHTNGSLAIQSRESYVRTPSKKTGFAYPTSNYRYYRNRDLNSTQSFHEVVKTTAAVVENSTFQTTTQTPQTANEFNEQNGSNLIDAADKPQPFDVWSVNPFADEIGGGGENWNGRSNAAALPVPTSGATEVPLSLAIMVDDNDEVRDKMEADIGSNEFDDQAAASAPAANYGGQPFSDGVGHNVNHNGDDGLASANEYQYNLNYADMARIETRNDKRFNDKRNMVTACSSECSNTGIVVFITTMIVTIIHLTLATTVYLYLGKLRKLRKQRKRFCSNYLPNSRINSMTPSSASSMSSNDTFSLGEGSGEPEIVTGGKNGSTYNLQEAMKQQQQTKPHKWFGVEDQPGGGGSIRSAFNRENVFFGPKEQRFFGINNYAFPSTNRMREFDC